jgi:predicted transcriptional regulator
MAPAATGPISTIQALIEALADRPDTTAAELAAAAGMGRSTASKLLATLATQGRVLRRPGGYQCGRRTPDRWTLITTTTTTNNRRSASTVPLDPPATQAAGPAPSGPAAGRLGAGELRDLVEGCLAQRPDQALTPTAIAKTLDRSAGAVANALGVLARQGRVVQAQTSPRRYIIAGVNDPAAATD